MMKFFPIILLLFLLVSTSCKSKSDSGANALLEQYFDVAKVTDKDDLQKLAREIITAEVTDEDQP